MDRATIATVWLEGCAGCHMSFLDIDEMLLDILPRIELTDSPITDFKDFDFRRVDVGIIEGAIGNDEQLAIARRLRDRCKILVAWGDCAVFGGINTLRNAIAREDVLKCAYIDSASTVDGIIPDDRELPALLQKTVPVNRMVDVDVYVPGCPPSPEAIAYSLTEILEGRIPVLTAHMLHFD